MSDIVENGQVMYENHGGRVVHLLLLLLCVTIVAQHKQRQQLDDDDGPSLYLPSFVSAAAAA